MSGVFCPKCGGKHESNGKFCEFCGTNLEEIILNHKSNRLPLSYKTEQTVYSGPVSQDTFQGEQRTSYSHEEGIDEYRRQRRTYHAFDVICNLLICTLCCLDNK